MQTSIRPVGSHLREWRQRRRMSQLDLACEANISSRHLSFVETGRAQPSRDMLLHLAERLRIPLRERNMLLLAAGYAPVFPERRLSDPALSAARKAVDLVLAGHEPYPALAVDRHWNLVAANRAVAPLIADADPKLLASPVNALRLSLHPHADMTFCDPPYNVDYANSPKDKLRGKHRPILNDDLGSGFEAFLYDACANILSVTKGACYICMSSSELHTLQRAFATAGGKWSTFVIWAKNTFTLGRADYQRQYEPILYGWKEGSDHYWCGARDQGDVWFIDKPVRNDLHPTMKPVALVERAIRNSSKSRDIVLDPFGGSGSTLIACEKAGRQARLIELDPKYCDVVVRRWQEWTASNARLESTGEAFREMAECDTTGTGTREKCPGT
jgi:DNA modification methylase/transcriptional regulator with XRE-family HTH domain